MELPGILHYSLRVSGTVQGVWFRKGTSETAKRLNISGHVENLPDGRVLIEAEGAPADMDAFISWCHKGPPKAKVDSVDIQEGAVLGLSGFGIRR